MQDSSGTSRNLHSFYRIFYTHLLKRVNLEAIASYFLHCNLVSDSVLTIFVGACVLTSVPVNARLLSKGRFTKLRLTLLPPVLFSSPAR